MTAHDDDRRAPTVCVIGGGAAGLTAAYRLLQRGARVQLLEAGPEPGGLVGTFEAGGEPLERFYHHIFKTDGAALRLFDDLGLSDRVEWHDSRVGVFHEGRLYPFTTALDLLRFSPLSIGERVRTGLMGLELRRIKDGSRFEQVTAAEWVRQRLGERALRTVWEPLLRGKFGEMWDRVAMTWLWARMRTRFSSRGGPMQREVLGYMRGSFGAWTAALAARLREMGCELRTGTPVRRIISEGGRAGVEVDGESAFFDAVVATVSNEVMLRVAPDLPEVYAERLRGIPYQDALCLVLELERPLTKYYWLNVTDRDAPFVAVVEHTNLVGPERYGGRHIVYASVYLDRNADLMARSEDEVFALFATHLKRINRGFDESWVRERHLFRAMDAQPVFTAGAGSRVPDHRTPLPGVYLANMAQIYPQDRGQNYAIEMGERVAALVAADLEKASAPRYQV